QSGGDVASTGFNGIMGSPGALITAGKICSNRHMKYKKYFHQKKTLHKIQEGLLILNQYELQIYNNGTL
ncbi:hypothetical protein J7J47_10790, partial [Halomonas sp. ISL-60]|uniref:hypothetical protein n=1 Tax=Halomonas sp. ISL-56 TaxID=2819149 RepID=UPI001BE9EC99